MVRRASSLVALAAAIVCFPSGSAQAQTWQPILIGSTGGLFADGVINSPFRIATHPTEAGTIYLGTGVLPTPGEAPPPADGFWKTTDAGANWAMMNEASTGDPALDFFEFTADTTVLDVAICPADSNVLAVATNPKGFFKSDDGGASWSWISAGIIDTDQDPGACESHPDLTFDTVDGRWTATTVAFDPNDCDTIYGGIADINQIDIAVGTGDHPGVFKTTDGGVVWDELNENLDPRIDSIICHPLDLTSKTIAPISLEVAPDGTVLLGTTEQDVDARLLAFSKSATSQARVWSNAGTGPWTEVSNGLAGSTVSETGGLAEIAVISVSLPFLTVSPQNNFYTLAHIGISSQLTLTDDTTFNRSSGIWRSQDLSQWVPGDNGIPVVNDGFSANAQTLGPVSVRPGASNIWVAGVNLADSVGAGNSGAWVSTNFGGTWFNSTVRFDGLEVSPSGLNTESNVLFVEWDANGACLIASVLWGDPINGGGETADDGVYRVCL